MNRWTMATVRCLRKGLGQAMARLLFPVLLLGPVAGPCLGEARAEEAPSVRKLLVRGDVDFPPYTFLEDGQPTGFSVELMRAVAEVMGLQLEIRLGPWHQVRAELEAGRIDALTGMCYTPERDARVDFVQPHSLTQYALFVRKGSSLHSLEEAGGKELIVQQGDVMQDELVGRGIPARIVPVENPAAALSLLASGMHDAALLARLQGLYLVERFRLGNIEMVESSLPPQQCGFAVREGDTALLARLNDGQAILRVNGRYRQIHDRWFGRFDERGDAGYQHLRRLLIWVLVLLTLLLVIVLVWLHSLKQLVHQRTEALQSELAEREKIEQTLREREEDYRRMFDAMADGLLIARVEDGAVLAANRAACEQHRRSSDEFRQLRLDEVVRREPSSDGDELSAVAPRPRATWPGGPACQPAAGLRPDDSTFDAELYRVPCRFQGKEAQLCVIRDVTERRQLEDRVRRAEKMESLGRLAAGVAHDLNNVLSGLVGYPDLILYDLPATSPLTGPLKTIKAAGERAAAIVQDLLVMARRGVASYTPLNLNVLVEQFLRSPEYLRLQTAHPRTRITVELDSGLLPLNGSVVHLTKSLTNLVANAMEAMPEGGAVVIRTENRYLDQPFKGYDVIREGEYVCLSVADTGTGIGEEQLQHIFEPFYTRKVMGRSGTGLGLTLVWGTVSDHQGYIDVQSTPGKGSVFSLYIPATRSQPVVAAAECSLDTLRSTGQSVLVVDDVAEQRSIACGMLRALGYATREAASGLEAVAALQEQPADLLLLDMIMDPGIDGLETYRRILEFRPGQKAILVSGYAETERAREARKLGAGSYVRKPYVLRQLAEAVHRELQGRQPTLRTPSPPASTPGESSRSSS